MDIQSNELLRFTTAGSVDDGKSTLIGRLLYDSKSIFEDQLEAVEHSSRKKGQQGVDLAMFTDGLRDEREQGITIDVAYRYFATPNRKFIIADTPGHIQYTRNMITGASTADAAIILIDVRHGVVEQTRRHAYIASLLQIPNLIVCVNKMDLVNFSRKTFESIAEDFRELAKGLEVQEVHFIPISALLGDNVVNRSAETPWYEGLPLLETLENLPICNDAGRKQARFPVQTVIRPQTGEFRDFRAYAGRMASGTFRPGDRVVVLPSGRSSAIREIHQFDRTLEEAHAPMSVALTLEDDIDIGRGDLIVPEGQLPRLEQEIEVMLCWLHDQPARPGTKYIVQHTSAEVLAVIREVLYKVDINSMRSGTSDLAIGMNDIVRARLRTTRALPVDLYPENRTTGSLILIDPNTNQTVAAAMIR